MAGRLRARAGAVHVDPEEAPAALDPREREPHVFALRRVVADPRPQESLADAVLQQIGRADLG